VRRTEILEATLRIIASGGPDAVTHRVVAAEARVPLGSTTYYFTSRDALLEEAFRHYLARASDLITELVDERPIGSAEDVAALLAGIARREFSETSLLVAEYELILHASRVPELARAFNAWQSTMAGRLAESIERLGATRPAETARTLISLLRGFELDRLTRPDASFDDLYARALTVLEAALPPRD
jgi:DNA-binding transcriptional regulator YbjK